MKPLRETLLSLFDNYDLNYIADQQCYNLIVDDIIAILNERGVVDDVVSSDCLFKGNKEDECYKVMGRCAICEHSKWYNK